MAENQSDTAVIEEVEEKEQTRRAPSPRNTDREPKRQPPYAVVVLNDDEHTYAYVIEVLQKTFGYSVEKAFHLADQVDKAGRAVVWSGAKETAEFKRDRIRGYGADVYAMKPVTFPLGCVIEPMPQ